MSETIVDKKIAWLKVVNEAFEAGRPEPALDQAGDILDLCLLSLEVVRHHPQALRDLSMQIGSPPLTVKSDGEKLVWFDCETTGLDPERDRILEVACIVTGKDLRVHEHATLNVALFEVLGIEDEWVRNQHTKSGLLGDCSRSVIGVKELQNKLTDLLESQGFTHGKAVLAGSSIHFDRGFIRRHLPAFDAALHYRMIDVSALNEIALRFAPDVYAARPTIPKEEIAHRALPDIMASIDVLKYYISAGLFGRP